MSGKVSYKINNWPEYNRSLVNRGNITLWFSPEVSQSWKSSKKHRGRGRPQEYSDAAIECCLAIRTLYRLPLRATQGFFEGICALLSLDLKIPNYTLLSKRGSLEKMKLNALESKEPINVVLDSTGLKIYGEGEWKTRTHGKSKRRGWKKLHLGVNSDTHEIIGFDLTDDKTHDCKVTDTLLADIDLANVCADGAYDNKQSYDAITDRGGTPLIPPRSGACLNEKPKTNGDVMRNHNILACHAMGRKSWKVGSGYHRRSLAETAMFRVKKIFGGSLASRKHENQVTEALLMARLLNKMTHLGMPNSYRVT